MKDGITFLDTTMTLNVLVMIGKGDSSRLGPCKAILWNRAIKKPFGNMEFPTEIVKIVLCEQKYFHFIFLDLLISKSMFSISFK